MLSASNAIPVVLYLLNLLLVLTLISIFALYLARIPFRHHPTIRYTLCITGILCLLFAPLLVLVVGGAPCLIVALPFNIPGGAKMPLLSTFSLSQILPLFVVIWTIGVVIGILNLLYGWKKVSELRRAAHPWYLTGRRELANELRGRLRAPIPTLSLSHELVSPVAVGILRPVVIFPAKLTAVLNSIQLQQVLLHECSHIQYRHTLGAFLERLARILFWYNPLCILLCRELAIAREEVSDNAASQKNGAVSYARTLLSISQGVFSIPYSIYALALVGTEIRLVDRIEGLLDPRRDRSVEFQRWKLWLVSFIVVLAFLASSGIRIVAATSP